MRDLLLRVPSIGRGTGSDGNGRRPSGDQADFGREPVDGDAHRHALREPHPVEGRVHIGQQVAARCTFAVLDAGREALNVSVESSS